MSVSNPDVIMWIKSSVHCWSKIHNQASVCQPDSGQINVIRPEDLLQNCDHWPWQQHRGDQEKSLFVLKENSAVCIWIYPNTTSVCKYELYPLFIFVIYRIFATLLDQYWAKIRNTLQTEATPNDTAEATWTVSISMKQFDVYKNIVHTTQHGANKWQ